MKSKILSKVVVHRYSAKIVFLRVLKISLEITGAGASF